jgi:uncharacterized protein
MKFRKENRMIRSIFLFGSAGLLMMFVAVSFSGCQKNDDNEDRFNRGAMLQHYAEALIIPSYTDLQGKINALQTAVSSFTNDPTTQNLVATQNAWKEAYLSWQYASPYNFGPAGEAGTQKALVEEIGTFPVSSAKIEQAVQSGTYNLNDFNRDARGLLAIEYLIFNLDDDNAVITESFSGEGRKSYLTDLVANVKTRIDAVVSTWNATYKNEFIAKAGTDVGSGTSMLYNEFVKSYEAIKNFKVALPLGLRAGQVTTEPTRVEAYYSGTSAQMLKTHYQVIENIWYGKSKNGTDGTGFHEYLQQVAGGDALILATENSMAQIRTAFSALTDTPRLSEQIDSTPAALDAVHTELQRHIRYFKSDMSSLLGIAITYASGDGD